MEKLAKFLKKVSGLLFIAVSSKDFNHDPLATARSLDSYQLNINDKYSRN